MPQPEKIQQLLAAGRAVAEGFLRDNGQVPPVMLAFSDDGIGSVDMQGRFAGILPATPPKDIEAGVAKKVLRSFGINPDGTRINPLWN